ncbi:protein Exd1 homolog isoform X2 [Drosophila bipectinata]|nr:protein Exd1 homolog [Drosophila bipectinata]
MQDSEGEDSDVSFYSASDAVSDNSKACIPLEEHELENLKEKLQRIVFIQQTDKKYHHALSDMRDQTILSLLVEPSFYGRHHKTSVLVVATANETYIFDIQSLGGTIFPELRSIFEAKRPRKVVHYSHRISDHFSHRHGISLGGVWDSFTALCLARRERTPRTLPEAVSLVFGLPLEKLLCEEVSGSRESLRNFTARPLSRSQLMYLAKMAILQLKMHDRLIYDNICAEMQDMTLALKHVYSGDNYAAMKMGPTSHYGFESIDPFYKIDTEELVSPTDKKINGHKLDHQKCQK